VIHTPTEDRIRRALPQAARLAGITADARQLGILARAAARAAEAPQERTRQSAPLQAREDACALRPRDVELLRLLAAGRTNTGIGIALGVTPSAAGTRVNRLARRLGVRSRVEAMARAYELGLLGGGGR
jgi:DNA-binding NarL/FixJ family response regulator